jgi:regulator of protease activity HflC (stomatin/prohibitin superfamily)
MKMFTFLTHLPSPLDALAGVTGLRRVGDDCGVTVHRFGRYVRTLGPGWHWTLPGADQLGHPVRLIGHHLDVPAGTGGHAELYYQILDPERAGPALDQVDQLVHDQTRDAIAALPGPVQPGLPLAEALKIELNRRVAAHGLRVIRCSLHAA